MYNNNGYFICRLRSNIKLGKSKLNDYTTILDGMYIRIVKYIIKEKEYIIATNLFDYQYNIIKQLYFKRWSIEEFFKYVKHNFNFAYLNAKNDISIKKTIYAQLIITKIMNIIIYLYEKNNKINRNYVINKRVFIDGLFNELLIKIITNKINKNTLSSTLNIIIKVTHTNKGKSIKITCHRPYMKWYIKKYHKRYIKTKINLQEE
jgi:hypothetical protein